MNRFKNFIVSVLCVLLTLSSGFYLLAASVKADESENDSSIVPKVYITTPEGDGLALKKEDGYVTADIKIVDVDGTEIVGDGQFKVRGNSTANGAKKPYTIKFNKKKDVFGLGSAKKWVLLANCFDPTLMRNNIALDLAHKLGLQYTPDFRVVELWLDDTFLGCYLLAEPIEANSNRVDIDVDNGDFIVEYEASRYEEGTTYFTCNPKAGVTYRFSASDPDELTEEQASVIGEILNSISVTICSRDYEQIQNVIDIDSFVKFYILNEYMKSVDFNYSSVYFYFKDGKLYAGPAWDFDLSSGNVSITSYAPANSYPYGGKAENAIFYKELLKCDEFRNEVHRQLYSNISILCDVYMENGIIDTLLDTYGDVFDRNYSEAGWNVGRRYSVYSKQPLATFDENVQFLRDWMRQRMEWLLGDSSVSVHSYTDENRICDLCGESILRIEDSLVTPLQDCEYTGEAICPDVQITMDELTLINSVDYAVTYENNLDVGTATVTIRGIGCYDGFITESFEILPTPTDIPTISPEITEEPVLNPTDTPKPTAEPTENPTATPTVEVTEIPTVIPTAVVTEIPSVAPTQIVTIVPSVIPTKPTEIVTISPTKAPITESENIPTQELTPEPTSEPVVKSEVEAFVERLYTKCLGRDAEVEGVAYWTQEIKSGKSGAVVAEGFFFSEEMKNRKLSDEEFINCLYETFMNRVPEKEGMEYWLEVIKNKDGIKFVFDGFVDSQEWADICLNYGIRSGGNAVPSFEKAPSEEVIAFAERLYTTCLERNAEKAGLEYWSAELANLRRSGSEAAIGFFFSEEFVGLKVSDDEFITRLYRTFMDREPEVAGYKFWIGELKSQRMNRLDVFYGFSVAPEFVEICSTYGIIA